MSRVARNFKKSRYYHIMSQGIERQEIFKKEYCKEKYKKLLYKYSFEFNIDIVAYCIMDNHVHILIKTEKQEDMSKMMHKINFQYAQYYNFINENRVGYVFRNRFISESILDEKYLYNCIKYIHNNPVKAKIVAEPSEYKYSSYNQYVKENKVDVYKKELIEDYIFIDVEIDKNEIVQNVLVKYEKMYCLTIDEIKKKINQDILKRLILDLKNNYKISYKMISETINISLSTIKRLIKND